MTTDDGKHALTLNDVGVDSERIDKDTSQRYFTISARVYEFDCVLLDTLNCHHCLTEEEQQSVAEEFVRRYNSHATLLRERDELRRALDKYGAHQPSCDKWETVGDQLYFHGGIACTCGLDAALTASADRKDEK